MRGHIIQPVKAIIDDAAAGAIPLLMTSCWSLDYSSLAFDGAPPLAAAPALAVPFPLVVTQPAPPAAGGGYCVYIYLWEAEHQQLRALVPAL